MLLRRDAPLAPLTTLRLGGPARELVTVHDEAELVEALRRAPDALLLAGGSNVVLPDAGVDGTVVRVATRGLALRREGGEVVVEAQAGEDWDPLVALLVSDGLAGLEALSGIPGSTGATPVQNVGAYGTEVAPLVHGVRVLERATGEVAELTPEQCGFGYRTSALKREPGRWVVLAVRFGLRESALSAPVAYAELAHALQVDVGGRAPLAEVREAVLALRRGKGMVVDPADPDSRSAGSFFTNPLVTPADGERLRALGAPVWPAAGERVKVSAAWLIESAGFRKGHPPGPVGLSSKHALALVHRGGGSADALVALAREVRDGVRTAFGVELEPEPVLVGAAL